MNAKIEGIITQNGRIQHSHVKEDINGVKKFWYLSVSIFIVKRHKYNSAASGIPTAKLMKTAIFKKYRSLHNYVRRESVRVAATRNVTKLITIMKKTATLASVTSCYCLPNVS